jgi:membrane protease YdiL (CAAX protease family)
MNDDGQFEPHFIPPSGNVPSPPQADSGVLPAAPEPGEEQFAKPEEHPAAENWVSIQIVPESAPSQHDEPLLFRSWSEAGYETLSRPQVRGERVPNLLHLALLFLVVCGGWLMAFLAGSVAIHAHLFGVTTTQQASSDVRYTLGTMVVMYLSTLAVSLLLFPLVWHKSFFSGLQWNGHKALRLYKRLVLATISCFVLAMLNTWLLPGPTNAPIDKIFRTPGAAWLLFFFGISFAPFFEEIVFRGFLLPTLCTAFDWIVEWRTGRLPIRLCPNGHPRWTLPGMVIGSLLTSVPFALIHAEQTAYSIGPFLLLVSVSLILCWVRLSTRSLAASVLVHASYNFVIFLLMLIGTWGFTHLDKM